MERLTEKRHTGYFVRPHRGGATLIYAPGKDVPQRYEGEIIDRLAHYEDLEMTPEEIQQTLENFSAFLCEVTGNRMSKTNCTKEAMIKAVHDYFDRLCDECYARKEYARYKDMEEQGRLVELPDPRPLEKMGKMVGGTFIINLTAQEITSILEAYFAGELVSKAALAASGKEGE